MIVDAHTHRYPSFVIHDPKRFASQYGESYWLDLVTPKKGKSLQGWSTREKMLADMEVAKVQKAALLGWYWKSPDTCLLQNDWHAQWLKDDPDRFFAFATMHPRMKDPVQQLKKRQDQGFVGIGECHPRVQDSRLKDPFWIKCFEFASDHGWPVTFHVTEPVGHNYAGRVPTPFEEFLWLAREFPSMNVILAHAGGLFPFFELNPKVQSELKNVYYDLAACPLLYQSSIYRKLIEVVGHKKILLGSDYPLRIFPKTHKEPDFLTYIEKISKAARLSSSEEKAIFGENFLSLLPC